MKTILVSWLGSRDFANINSPAEEEPRRNSPAELAVCTCASLLKKAKLDEVVLLWNYGNIPTKTEEPNDREYHLNKVARYCSTLQIRTTVPVNFRLKRVENVTDYTEVYDIVSNELERIINDNLDNDVRFVFHISSGTPTMQAIWLLLSKTEYPSTILLKTSQEMGLELVDFPFDIAVKNQPYYTDDPRFQNLKPESLRTIKWQSDEMRDVLALSGNIARHDDMRVLIQGETGSGKELFAQLIHENSPRASRPFETLNCGAIPENLIESELFGHRKGAFTGAETDKKGVFELANGGTLFLDEIGELPLLQQVKILRMTDRHRQFFKPVGSEKAIQVNVRIIAATHRNLMKKVADGSFREDLFYRLCDAMLKLPPLRERTGDIERLADHFVGAINNRLADEEEGAKSLSSEARQFLRAQQWPGNVRELEATISRAYRLYSRGPVISRKDIEQSMIAPIVKNTDQGLLNRPFNDNFNIGTIEIKVRTHYIIRAIKEIGEVNIAEVAKMLGLKKGTFAKQLRENSMLKTCLEEHIDGRRLLARLKSPE
jgi:DNA-binding NtrC family response regulator